MLPRAVVILIEARAQFYGHGREVVVFHQENSRRVDVCQRYKTFETDGTKFFLAVLESQNTMQARKFRMSQLQALLPGFVAEAGADQARLFEFGMGVVGVAEFVIEVLEPRMQVLPRGLKIVAITFHGN